MTDGRRLWAATGDGMVVRLDPRTLAVKARRRIAHRRPGMAQEPLLPSPVVGLGSLWMLTGDKTDLELLRADPATLAVRSRTRLSRLLRQTIERVVADSRHVYLVGSAIAPVDAGGRVGKAILEPDLAAVALHGSGFVCVTSLSGAIVLVDANGRIHARTALRYASQPLALDGRDLWLLGDAGRGFGIVHVRLAAAQPSS